MYKMFFAFILYIFMLSCNSNTSTDKEHANNFAHADSANIEIITLQKEKVFNDRNAGEFLLPGNISAFDVDDNGNVYIAPTVPGNVGIYIFNSNGDFIKKLGRYGKGPGDFEAITSLTISRDYLHAFDPRLQKISTYSLNDYKLVRDNVLDTRILDNLEDTAPLFRAKNIHAIHGGDILLAMGTEAFYDLNKEPFIKFYKIDDNGEIESNLVTQMERYRFYNGDGFKTGNKISERPFTAPFTRTSRIAVSEKGYIYSSWTDKIEIHKVHVDSGLVDTIRFPFKNTVIDLQEIKLSDDKIDVMREQGLPKDWPALYTMEVDDNEQLWIATITESDSTYDWFVLNKIGDLRGKFTLNGRRADNFVRTKPRFKIKNKTFYEHQYDYWDGIDQIVSYSISYPK